MIRLHDIRLSFADKALFAGVDWVIPEAGRVGLVGDNGSGKTTLLRIILGEAAPDSGRVEAPSRAIIGYLPQDLQELEPLPLALFLKKKAGLLAIEEALHGLEEQIAAQPEGHPEHAAVLKKYESLREQHRHRDGFAFEAKAKRVLGGLGFSSGDGERNCRDFSGGWKMRISLAVILLQRPDIMLLDEPTNHLDTESMEWLESYLKDYRGTLVAVSHDHMFLDKMTRQTAEIFRGKLERYKGNYSFFLREKEKRSLRLAKERELQKAEIKRVQVFIERFRYKASKAAQVQSRIKLLERYEVIPEEERAGRVAIHFPDAPRSEKEVIVARELGKQYGERTVLDRLSFAITRGEKVALVGVNGAGKSTLSRLLAGIEPLSSGEIRRGEQVRLDSFFQEMGQNLDYGNTVFDEALAAGGKATDQERRNLLGAFLFSGDAVTKRVGVLSGGEKSRLALLKLLLQPSNCLILDEPTNHLDIRTKEVFQRALLAYAGTVVIVSHDRHFLDDLVSRVFEIRGGRLHIYEGNYSYFIQKRGGLEEESSGEEKPVCPEERPDAVRPGRRSKEQKRLEAEARNLRLAQRREIKGRLDALEEEITLLEGIKSRLEQQLSDPLFLKESARIKPAALELKRCTQDLEERNRAWEELMAELETLDALP